MSQQQPARGVRETEGGAASTLYRMDPGRSRFTVQAFAGGLLSFIAHSPTFGVRDFEGELFYDPTTPAVTELAVLVRADSLELVDHVPPGDREEIVERMRHEVLEADTYPEIGFMSDVVTAERSRLRIAGRLVLHGTTNRHTMETELQVGDDGVRLAGESSLRLSEYRIRPVTALGGAIRLRDELRLAFDLFARREG